MSWTTPEDLRAQVQRLWDRGVLLGSGLGNEGTAFPWRLLLKSPSSSELSTQFPAVQGWIGALRAMPNVRIEWREVRHRIIGSNRIPDAVWVDTLDHALALLGKEAEARQFSALQALTQAQLPAVLPWLESNPLGTLRLASVWARLLQVTGWMQSHPCPQIYLRQIDLPGIDSKFVEAHRMVLSALFDLVLPAEAIDARHGGTSGFARRYGFLDKPLRIRLRLLDPALALLRCGTDQDLTLRHDSFASLDSPVRRVFITENEINFLAFPCCVDSMVIFGGGYGFDMLSKAAWLHRCDVHYWGDIDTHGFAILSQLRAHLPQAKSFLMDAETLLVHRPLWGDEPTPELKDLPRLTDDERALFDDLRDNRLGQHMRLEQERIGFEWLKARLAALP